MEQIAGRVSESSSDKANQRVRARMLENIAKYKGESAEVIRQRIMELDREWDIERALETNASTLVLSGVLLGVFVNKRWLVMSGVVASFLLQHGLQGWCPPLPLLRKLGLRTRREIDEEKFALKQLRGDFQNISENSEPMAVLKAFRKI